MSPFLSLQLPDQANTHKWCVRKHNLFDSHDNRMCSLFAFAWLLLTDIKLYSSFSQRLHERVRFSRELNKLNAIYSWQFLFSPDS